MDRDGTLVEDTGYLRDPETVELVDQAGPSLVQLRRSGFVLIVISNQSGLGRGIISPEEARAVHGRMVDQLRQQGVSLTATYYCPHRPDEGCRCRKPSPFLLELAASAFSIDLAESWMVGDKASDVQAGWNAGCRTALLGTPAPGCRPDVSAPDWPTVAQALAGEM